MVKIGVLFQSWLTLYGENGNIKSLVQSLSGRGIEVETDYIESLDEVNLNDYDFLYIGSGRITGLDFALKEINKNKDRVLDYINSDKVMMVTGNAIKALSELGIYKIHEGNDYFVSDVSATSVLTQSNIRAFQNTKYILDEQKEYLFELERGISNYGLELKEGYRYKELYLTSMIGPVLALNDEFREYIIDRIIK